MCKARWMFDKLEAGVQAVCKSASLASCSLSTKMPVLVFLSVSRRCCINLSQDEMCQNSMLSTFKNIKFAPGTLQTKLQEGQTC